ncbi:MAG: thiol-disulfide oxidoreductase DCC family protein [Kiritimatiellaeota bacterium]|nr:thiol-disulfide oxidoreductase DCC family protein [Kiritimatiellota bacterium]
MNATSQASALQNGAIVLYDGVCNLCSGWVRFIFKRDRAGYFRFGQLQSEQGRSILEQYGLPAEQLTTIVLVEGETVFMQSDAFLRIVQHLRFPWPALVCLLIFPRRLRDAVYGFIARHRYRWFGQKDTCELPPPELRSRFL